MEQLTKEHSDFFLALADDCRTLEMARDMIQSHPLNGGLNELIEASLCRLFIVNRVNMVEALLEYWKGLDSHEILQAYFPPKKQNVKTKERIKSLESAFVREDFEVDPSVFEKYLGFKFLRNVISHGELKDDDRVHLETINLPTDLQKLGLEHTKDLARVSSRMVRYVLETKLFRDNDLKRILLNNRELARDLDLFVAGFNPQWAEFHVSDDLGLFRKSDLARIFWRNLEKISEQLDGSSLGTDEVVVLSSAAEESWSEFWRLIFSSNFVEVVDLKGAVKFFNRYHRNDYSGLTTDESNSSFIIGSDAEKAIPNITVVALFLKQLPRVDPSNTPKYRVFGEQAFAAWEAAYYARKHPTDGSDFDYDHLETYRRILNAE